MTPHRHRRYPACTTNLEPDLKAGAAGSATSTPSTGGACGGGEPSALVEAGLLRRREVEALRRPRTSCSGSERPASGDWASWRPPPPSSSHLAEAFGFGATAGVEAPDALMRHLFEHARTVDHVREAFFDRALSDRAESRPRRLRTPQAVMAAFAASAEGQSLAPATLTPSRRPT